MTSAIVVTGVGAVTPLGTGAERLLSEWSAGTCAIADGVGRCDHFDPSEWLSARDLRRTDRVTQLAIAACEEAVQGAGWGECPPFDPYRVACILGTSFGAIDVLQREYGAYRESGGCIPHGLPPMLANAAAAEISLHYGLHGPCTAAISACAAGADAVAGAVRMIRAGEVDAAIVAGAESAVSELSLVALAAGGAISKTGVCRPFDARRDGFVVGEGAGVLVLESEAAAERRGATELARVIGFAMTSDGFDPRVPDPGAQASVRAIEGALADADVEVEQIAYVNASGMGTQESDLAETRALKMALKDHAHAIPISSLKSAVGHLLGAAGAVEAIATVLALRAGIAPPTLGYEVPDEQLDLDYNPEGREISAADGRLLAISNSFGLGGHNVVLAFESRARTAIEAAPEDP